MIAAPRPTQGPHPGDLYLDPLVPEGERVTVSRSGWSAQASHVWTGTGWARLVPGVVQDVPAHPEVTLPRVPSARRGASSSAARTSTAGLEGYRRRRAAREQVQELVREGSAVADAS